LDDSESVDALEELDVDVSELEVVKLKNVELELNILCVLVLSDDSDVEELVLTLDSEVELEELVTLCSVDSEVLELVVKLKNVLELVTVELLLEPVLPDVVEEEFELLEEESTFNCIFISSIVKYGSKNPPEGTPVN